MAGRRAIMVGVGMFLFTLLSLAVMSAGLSSLFLIEKWNRQDAVQATTIEYMPPQVTTTIPRASDSGITTTSIMPPKTIIYTSTASYAVSYTSTSKSSTSTSQRVKLPDYRKVSQVINGDITDAPQSCRTPH